MYFQILYFLNHQNKIRSVLCSLLIMLCFQSCQIFDPGESIPSLIAIDKIKVVSGKDTISSKIIDAWVYIDDDLQGTYQLPCNFPVLKSGDHNISIKAGIYLNGSSVVRVPYPFYTIFSANYNLKMKEKQYINPVIVNYIPQSVFELNEDFEKYPVMKFTKTSQSQVDLVATNNKSEVFEGNNSGLASLNSTNKNFEVLSDKLFLPVNNTSVFLEMNYRTENPVTITLRVTDAAGMDNIDVGGINVSGNQWGKIYFELGGILSDYPTAEYEQIIISSNLDNSLSSAKIYFDNIKIVHR